LRKDIAHWEESKESETPKRALTDEETLRIQTIVEFDGPFALQNFEGQFGFGGSPSGSVEVSYRKRSKEEIESKTGWKIEGEGTEVSIIGDPYGLTDFSHFSITLFAPLPFQLEQLPSSARERLAGCFMVA